MAKTYHLCQLARHGFIEEEQRDGRRERCWRHRERRVVVPDAEDFPADAMPVRVLALGLPHTQEDS